MSSAGQRRTLAGRYRLEDVIGRGGMSTVYRATDLSLDREVAVKVALDPMAEENPVYVARFKREARAAAALSHPGVVTVFDAGTDGATRYIVMEYVDGQDLSEVLREQGPLEPARAARIGAQIADTLAAAHAAGIVHRDVKPGNVMVTAGDRVKVLDFGIARTSDGVTLTQASSVLGTAPYMAPEQAMGNPADARSDIYSLGCVLYEMLTGKPPFTADVPAAVLHQHVRVAPKPASQLNPSVPPALDALLLQMLAKAPGDRPQSAAEVRDRLTEFGRQSQTEPTRPLPAAGAIAAAAAAAAEVPQVATVAQAATVRPPSTPPPAATAGTRAMPPSRRPRSGPWAFLAVVAVLLLGAAVAYALATGGGTAKPTSSASHPSAPASHSSTLPASHSTPAASSSSSSSSSSSTPSTPTSTSSTATTTTTVTTTTTTPSGPPGGPQPTPPGPGGTPPGQAKKKK